MNGEPVSDDKSIIDGGRATDETLTLDDRDRLGDLALFSEGCINLGDSLGEASRTMGVLVERQPEFNGPCVELLVKMRQLHGLVKELGREVICFSHMYEDTVTGASHRPENDWSRRNPAGHWQVTQRRRI